MDDYLGDQIVTSTTAFTLHSSLFTLHSLVFTPFLCCYLFYIITQISLKPH
jgi:hypothetical protein